MQSKMRAKKLKALGKEILMRDEMYLEKQRELKEACHMRDEYLESMRTLQDRKEQADRRAAEASQDCIDAVDEHKGCAEALQAVKEHATERCEIFLNQLGQMKKVFMRGTLHQDIGVVLTDKNLALMDRLAKMQQEHADKVTSMERLKQVLAQTMRHRDALVNQNRNMKDANVRAVKAKFELVSSVTALKLLRNAHTKLQT